MKIEEKPQLTGDTIFQEIKQDFDKKSKEIKSAKVKMGPNILEQIKAEKLKLASKEVLDFDLEMLK